MKAEYIDHMGDDLAVVNAARVSFDKKSLEFTFKDDVGPGGKSDEGLIQYLAKHDHWTPFAHTSIKLRMQAPVPIRTQCFKHKQGFIENEESRRYINSTPEVYHPDVWRKKPDGSIKQGSGEPFDGLMMFTYINGEYDFLEVGEVYASSVESSVNAYEQMIRAGVCPEQARLVLPQGCEVNWIWTGNLYSFANFYNKRTEAHAQKEIQALAHSVGEVIEPLFPVSWKALTTGA